MTRDPLTQGERDALATALTRAASYGDAAASCDRDGYADDAARFARLAAGHARVAARLLKKRATGGRVDCPLCGQHGGRCQEDRDDGTTICHTTGGVVR